MPSDDTIQRLFEKLDTLKDVVNEVKIDVATIKSNQSKHYELNDKEHQNMVAIIADTKTEVDDIKEDISGLKEGHDEQQSVLDVRQGMHKIVWWILGGVGAFIAGGAGWILSKVSGG